MIELVDHLNEKPSIGWFFICVEITPAPIYLLNALSLRARPVNQTFV